MAAHLRALGLASPPARGSQGALHANHRAARAAVTASPRTPRPVVGRPGGALYSGTSRTSLDALRRINAKARRVLLAGENASGLRHPGE